MYYCIRRGSYIKCFVFLFFLFTVNRYGVNLKFISFVDEFAKYCLSLQIRITKHKNNFTFTDRSVSTIRMIKTHYLHQQPSYSFNMARTVVAKPTNCSVKCIVFFLFLGCVSSQNCTDPLLSKCRCAENVFVCMSANLTAFPTDVPHKETVIHIRVTNNSIPVIDTDILSGFTQLQSISLEDNGLTRIANQSLPANLTTVILNSNPIICDASLLWLTMVSNVSGYCDSGVQIATFLGKFEYSLMYPEISSGNMVLNI